jgi:acetyl esterase/lipase
MSEYAKSHTACGVLSPARWQGAALARGGLAALLLCGVAACSPSSSADHGDAGQGVTGSGGAAVATGGATAPASAGSGGAVVAITTGGASGGPSGAGSGGTAVPGGSGGGSTSSGGTGSGSGGRSGASGGNTQGSGGSPVATPPVSDATSTLGVSAAGGAYHVEGNIPYGPSPMQRLDVIYPNAAGPKGTTTLPAVIMFHGGGWIDNKPAALKASMSSFFSRFLAHGFMVCNVEYRLADGTANGAIAPAAAQDALLAAKWFWDHLDYYHGDKTRYVATGASAGGHLALMVGMATAAANLGPTNPTDFKIAAIVNGYGPADVTDLLAKNVSFAVQWLPASTPNRAALAKQVSPVTYVRMDVPPLITVQGMDDHTVPISESQNLFDLLTAAGADTALHYVPGAGHGFSTPASAWPDAEPAMFNFLVKHGIGK